MTIKIKAMLAPWRDDVQLLIVDEWMGRVAYVQDLTLTTIETGAPILNPSCSLSKDAAQELMDNLWQCGLRPSEGSGSAGALAATQKHLDDMRRVSFDLLDKVLNLPTIENREAKD